MNKPYISASVGRNGRNRPVDVAMIQSLLNEYFTTKRLFSSLSPKPSLKLPTLSLSSFQPTPLNLNSPSYFSSTPTTLQPLQPYSLLTNNYSFKVDGLIGMGQVCSLCEAIEQFQQDVVGMKKPDGCIDHNGNTFRKLLNNNIKERRNIIFTTPLLPGILSRVNVTQFNQLFNGQFDGLLNYPKLRKNNGLNKLIAYIKIDQDIQDVRWAAYMLATAYHETAFSFLPIKEYKKGVGRDYGTSIRVTDTKGIRGKKGAKYQNVYYGRGYVQLTWYINYQTMGKNLKLDDELYVNPDRALDSDIAYKIMSYGMRCGSFTDKKLSDYINDKECNYSKARKIINGMDKAEIIARYAEDIELLLRLSIL